MSISLASRPTSVPARFGALTTALLAFLTVLTVVASPASAGTPDGSAEQRMFDLLNGERSSRGLATLRATVDLVEVARKHSNWMADNRTLQHNGQLATDVVGWTVLSENVGYSSGPETLHSALMDSTGHRANILDGRVTQVGVGAARDSRGTLWITQVFRRPDASTTNVPTASFTTLPTTTPDVTVTATGTLLTADRASDGSATLRTLADSGFNGGTTSLGGGTLEPPVIDATPQGQVAVVARGLDRGMWLRLKPDGGAGYQPWLPLGGSGTSRPAVTSWGQGRLDVVVRGGDGALWHRSQLSPGNWTGWMSLGGQFAPGAEVSAVSAAPGQLVVAGQGTDGQVWYRSYGAHGWSHWMTTGGWSKGGPALSTPSQGRVVLAVKGTDDAGWTRSFDNGYPTGGWTRLGGVLATAPTAAGADGRVDVMTVGTDGNLYRNVQQSGTWSGWRRVS